MSFDVDSVPFPWIRRELGFERELARGNRGAAVECVQEWLTLNGVAVVVDGRFGPATEYAVRRFQGRRDLEPTGVVDEASFAELTAPLRLALEPPARRASSIEAAVVDAARRHLRQRPREVGGANRGPWVRTYMEGNDGPGFLWCAGFAALLVRQAAFHCGLPDPLRPTFSCDVLARDAQNEGRFVPGDETELDTLPRGSLFVQRRSPGDWNHTGVVIAAMGEVMETIEGNTNEGGDREGFEVCRRIRSLENKDFVTLQPLRA
jgi:hypothetical protein